ncbi:MAG: M15 family metallopeptidase [Fusobacteriaceae bacterium]|jgi:D-alanyl-D-alanine dipeptidase|nr:M15 family metallopeptidase [Fusobacteriaceae bacterium]
MINIYKFKIIFITTFLSIFLYGTQVKIKDEDFILVTTYIPSIYVDLKYAGEDNFTGQKIYDFNDAYLRYGTIKKLKKVQENLLKKGYSLKIWDAFRPPLAQFKLWEVVPDARYVANPKKYFSPHSRGNTVDITMVTAEGEEIPMPTQFDEFSKKADRDYSDNTKEQKNNALILEKEMIKAGFIGYHREWWHYVDAKSYPVEKKFIPKSEIDEILNTILLSNQTLFNFITK